MELDDLAKHREEIGFLTRNTGPVVHRALVIMLSRTINAECTAVLRNPYFCSVNVQ